MREELLFNRFQVIKPIGEGGMGKIKLVKDLNDDNLYALKTFKRENNILQNTEDPESVLHTEDRFKEEFQICKKIDHKNVVKVYEFFEDGDSLAYTMEYIKECTLAQVCYNKDNELSIEAIEYISLAILNGLSEIHRGGNIHRDLKPDNILIDTHDSPDFNDWTVKVTDLGLAKKMIGDAKRTAPHQRLGSMYYMSPEYHDKRALTTAHDVFSFGIILYEMFTNKPSRFCELTATGLRFRAVENSDLLGIPKKYKLIIRKCLELTPTFRYQYIRQVIGDFETDERALELMYKDYIKNKGWIPLNRNQIAQTLSVLLVLGLVASIGFASFTFLDLEDVFNNLLNW